MSILLDNKILEATEKKIEGGLTPENRADYMKIVVAGMKVALQGGPNGILASLKQSKNPVSDAAMGAINLVALMSRQSRGTMPPKSMVPAAMTLMLQALDFADKTGIVKIGTNELDQATKIFANHIFAALHITQPMLQTAAKNIHDVMADPQKRALIDQKAGVVKAPGANAPGGS